jgi:hypothetical protein
MDEEKIMRALGRIEGELVELRKLTERVRRLELWCAAVLAASILSRGI